MAIFHILATSMATPKMAVFFVYGPIFTKIYILVTLPKLIMIMFSDFKNFKICESYDPPNVPNAHCLQTELFGNICKGYKVEISYTGRLSIDHHRKTPKVAIFFFPGVQNHPKALKTCLFLYLYYCISRKKCFVY